MKTFKEYIQDNDQISKKQKILNNLIKLSWSRYNPETRDFYEKMASKDADLRRLIQKLDSANMGDASDESDVITQNASDSNFGNEEL